MEHTAYIVDGATPGVEDYIFNGVRYKGTDAVGHMCRDITMADETTKLFIYRGEMLCLRVPVLKRAKKMLKERDKVGLIMEPFKEHFRNSIPYTL